MVKHLLNYMLVLCITVVMFSF